MLGLAALRLSFVLALVSPAARTGAVPAPGGDPPGAAAARRIAATLELAAQEYRLAWSGARLASPAEALEAKLFVGEARRAARELPPSLAREVDADLAAVERLLGRSAPADSFAQRAAEIERRLTVALGISLGERPAREPSLAAGARIYGARCASCHGERGTGDGPSATGMTPPPANLADPRLLASSTPLDYYRRISLGVPGTAMPAFADTLSADARWDVVAHVLTLTDSLAARQGSGSRAIVFATVRGTLGGGLDLARRGERRAAAAKVLDAYMAFEAVEGALRVTDPRLVSRAEGRFAALREAAATGAPIAAVERRHAELLDVLAEAESALGRGRSAVGLFAESLLLMLREGFEAILIIAAIIAVLVKAGASDRKREVWWGVGLAVAASIVTAVLLELLFRVTPAQREALEGGVMLVAAAMLFYVSYWLISKIEVAAWQRFVKDKIRSAVENGSAVALAAVAFLAVYREGFETVLFYKALYATGGAAGAAPISLGFLLGAVSLVVLYLGIETFGLRIPIRPFFAVTGALLYYMAFVFAGTGVKELQEGAVVSTTIVPGAPRSPMLGVYPTVESLAAQGVILLALLVALVWMFVVRPLRRRAPQRALAREPGGAEADTPPAPRQPAPV